MTPGQRAPVDLRVGDYALLTRIGEGGMGVVHLARRDDGERVALKVLRPHVVGDDEARRRLAREVSSLSRVRSPRVAEIVDSDPWGPIPFVATRYVPGLSLHDHIVEEGPLQGQDLIHFALGLAEAIEAVHAVGVLHRDIKPSNVLMEGRNPVLIDFGLARVAEDADITRTGWLLGTPGYLAPEILHGREPTSAADVHSWAATVAYAGTGRPPFGRGPSVAVMDRVRRGEHDLTDLGHEVLGPVLKALDPDPAARPTLAQLTRMLGGDPGASAAAGAAAAAAGTAAAAAAAPPTMTMPLASAPDHQVTDRLEPQAATTLEGGEDGRVEDGWVEESPQPTMAPSYAPYQTPPAPDPTWRPAPAPTEQQPGDGDPFAAQAAPVPSRAPLLERVRRWVLGAGLLAATTGAVVLAPYVAGALVAVLVVCLRALSLSSSAGSERRLRRGRKWYDGTLAVLTAPWHFLVSFPASVMLLLWAYLIAACVGVVLVVLGVDPVPTLTACGAALSVALWTGPGSSRLRTPVERAGFPIAAHPAVWLVTAVLLTALASGLIAYASSAGVAWAPFQDTPWDGWAWVQARV